MPKDCSPADNPSRSNVGGYPVGHLWPTVQSISELFCFSWSVSPLIPSLQKRRAPAETGLEAKLGALAPRLRLADAAAHPNPCCNDWLLRIHRNGKRDGLNKDNLLLRGCTIRNTEEAVGIVIYAGGAAVRLPFSGDFPSRDPVVSPPPTILSLAPC